MTSLVSALGYLGFSVSDLPRWMEFAENLLGVSVHKREDGCVDLRIDDYAWRIRLVPAEKDDLLFVGWEVKDDLALNALAEQLEAMDYSYRRGTEEEISSRQVRDLIVFTDPDGNQCEAFFGPCQKTDQPFVSPSGVKFKTGQQGLGHVVLITRDHSAMEAFYRQALGLKLSDYINTEVVPGRPLEICFLRCNGRHHSLALAPVPVKSTVAHIMFETCSIDDVGRALDAVNKAGEHISFTLGRHSNDEMLSFYVMSPSGFDVEYGCGGLEVDDETWHVKTHTTNSAWGHEFQLPPRKPKNDG